MSYVINIILAIALFLALVLNMALKPKKLRKLSGYLMISGVILGFLIYGYGYIASGTSIILSILRTAYSVIGMFMGKNDYSAISSAPYMKDTIPVFLFWLSHIMAFYSMANAVFGTLGGEALRKIRQYMNRAGNKVLIFGDSDEAVKLAKDFSKTKGVSVILIQDRPGASVTADAKKLNLSLQTDETALKPTKEILKSWGISNKYSLDVFVLQESKNDGKTFARALLNALKDTGIDPAKTSLTIFGEEQDMAENMQNLDDTYGYGHVFVLDHADLAARVMLKNAAPWDSISFDENAKATENFECLVIGFGQVGQKVLKTLTMNGQFEGSHFQAGVISKDVLAGSGYFRYSAPEMFAKYDISFMEGDGRSSLVFEYIESHPGLKYIAVCISDEAVSFEVAQAIERYLEHTEQNIQLLKVSKSDVRIFVPNGDDKIIDLYTKDVLSGGKMDERAMQLNHTYMAGDGKTSWEHWAVTDAFSRMSSRASADFIPALIKASGYQEEEILENWNLTDTQKDNLGRTEHLRWCAFHYASGYHSMTETQWNDRVAIYEQEKKETGKGKIRLAKDTKTRIHACLVSWEELKELDARESAVTGVPKDYQQLDVQNVLMIPELLKNSN